MTKKEIINQLVKSYNLSDNQRDILLLLIEKDLTAEEILARSTVSNGRIYKILAEMETTGIIEKIGVKPSYYSMKDFAGRVRKFLDWSFDGHIQSKLAVGEALSKLEDKTEVEVILGSKDEYDLEIERMLLEGSWVKLVHKHISLPWFLYCFLPEDQFFQIREAISQTRLTGSSPEKTDLLAKRAAYQKVYQSKAVEHVMLKESLNMYYAMLLKLFGEKEVEAIKLEITKKQKELPKVKINVLDKLFTPFSTYITDREVIIPMFFEKKENRMLRMRGAQVVKTYQDYFEEYKKVAKEGVEPS